MAILFKDAIYIHMPKTGGCWIRDRLDLEPNSRRILGEHTPIHKMRAADVEDRMLWGTIRDPWSWYASWYIHTIQHPSSRSLFAEYGGGSIEFKDVLKGIFAKKSAPQMLGVLWWFHDETWNRELFFEDQTGLYSWVVRYMYGSKVKTLVDMGQMSAGLQELFGLETARESHPPVNRRIYEIPPQDMYDDELIAQVWEADELLVRALGYTEPFGKAPSQVIVLP